MKKRKFSLTIILGGCLVLLSLFLLIVLQIRAHTGNRQSQRIASKMEELLPERTAGVPGTYSFTTMPVLEIEGTDYSAMLEIPAFGCTLPVADKWDSSKLSRSPARFWGSAYDGTLVIGGSDDPQQFGFCDKIGHGTQVILTDMTGSRFTYTVSRIDRSRHAETYWLATADDDLTLFCHGISSTEYIAVRCTFAYN